MSSLTLKVSERTKSGSTFFEGTVTIPGAKPTKLVKKSDQTTQFSTRSSLLATARNFAKRLGFGGVDTDTPKKSITTKSRTTTKGRTATKSRTKSRTTTTARTSSSKKR